MTQEERDKLLNDLKEFWWGSGFDADGLYHSILTRIINALPVSDPAPVTPTCDGNCKGKWYSFIPDEHVPSNTFLMLARSNQLQGNLTLDELIGLMRTIVTQHQAAGDVSPVAITSDQSVEGATSTE